MSFITLAKKRYSCRHYKETKVEKEKLDSILEAGRVAPTAVNYQPQRILVIQEEEGLEKVAKAARVFGAPLILLVCVDRSVTWTRPIDGKQTTDIDASIVTDHMMLEATELGLGSVWICYFDEKLLKKDFNIPEHYDVVNILAIGYEAREGKSPERHDTERSPINATVTYETF